MTQNNGFLCFVRHNFHAYRQAAALVFDDAPTAPPMYPPNVAIKVQQDGAIVITGALNPNAVGTYAPVGEERSHPCWECDTAAGTYYIHTDPWGWTLSDTKGWSTHPQWKKTTLAPGGWTAAEGATGAATNAWSYVASLARFAFPPENYPDPSPFLQVYTYSGKPITAGRSFYKGPWSILSTFTPSTPATTANVWRRWTWPDHATGSPYVWPAGGTGKARAYAIAQDMLTGARSTKYYLEPTFGSLTPW